MRSVEFQAGLTAGLKAAERFVFKLFLCTVVFILAVVIGTIISSIIYPI